MNIYLYILFREKSGELPPKLAWKHNMQGGKEKYNLDENWLA